jgi:hypothetical protein
MTLHIGEVKKFVLGKADGIKHLIIPAHLSAAVRKKHGVRVPAELFTVIC